MTAVQSPVGSSLPASSLAKRPPGPPPKRTEAEITEEELPLSKRKPPPSEAPPSDSVRDLSQVVQGPKPPKAVGPPPDVAFSKNDSAKGKAQPDEKAGGRSPVKLPPPGAPPPLPADELAGGNGNGGANANADRGDKPIATSERAAATPPRRRPPPGVGGGGVDVPDVAEDKVGGGSGGTDAQQAATVSQGGKTNSSSNAGGAGTGKQQQGYVSAGGPPPRGPPPGARGPQQQGAKAAGVPGVASAAAADEAPGGVSSSPQPAAGGIGPKGPPPRGPPPKQSPLAPTATVGKDGAAPPAPGSRPPAPYKPPPGAPSGKSPPRMAPPSTDRKFAGSAAAGMEGVNPQDLQSAVTGPPRRPAPAGPPPVSEADLGPKGRRPPDGAPPGTKPAAPKSPPRAVENRRQAEEPFPELRSVEEIPRPDGLPPSSSDEHGGGVLALRDEGEAPPPPDEPPPAVDDDREVGAPLGAPPRPGKDNMPRPPSDMTDEERQISERLKRGRLSVKILQAQNIRRKDASTSAAKIDAYVVAQLGDFKKAPRLKTQVRKRSNQNPQFAGEVLSFDMIDPSAYVRDNDVKLKIEVWDNNAWNDDILGEVTLSAVRFFGSLATVEEWLPLKFPGDQSSNSRIQIEVKFEEAKVGMAIFTLYEGKNLGTSEMKLGKTVLSPYVSVSIGEGYHKKSQTQSSGGADPYFGEEQLLMWVDGENWVKPAEVTVWHEDIGDHDPIGKCMFPLLPYMMIKPGDAAQELIPLTMTKESTHEGVKSVSTGDLLLKVEFLLGGDLSIAIKSGKNLRETDSMGRLDPYVVCKTEGDAVKINKRTTVDKDGGINPDWNQTLKMDVVDHYQLELECYDHDVLASQDELIGRATVSLLPVFKKGHVDTWITLKHKNQYNVLKDAGELHVIFDFKGEHGVAFPQHQPSIDSFDDSQRIDFDKVKRAEDKRRKDAESNVVNTDSTAIVLAQDVLQGVDLKENKYDCGYTDEDIRQAFDFIDLDRNDYVGAAEIRHVLICMGELITDEEVDMMITMVDSDGDGQVGYDEFYMMVTDVDPARPEFGKKDDKEGSNRPVDGKAYERQKEMAARDMKRRMLTTFITENQVGPTEIAFAWEKYGHLPKERVPNGSLDFEIFCELLQVEPTGEYHKLFGLFDADGSGTVDIKEFILGLCNFVEMDNEKKCRFIFELFDEDHSGFLALGELEEILMANHMTTRKACQKKAQTIMRAADIDGSGAISLAEFIVCSAKFPNILFPNLRES